MKINQNFLGGLGGGVQSKKPSVGEVIEGLRARSS